MGFGYAELREEFPGLVSALYELRGPGLGQYLDVSLFESAVSLAVWEDGSYFAAGKVSRPTARRIRRGRRIRQCRSPTDT